MVNLLSTYKTMVKVKYGEWLISGAEELKRFINQMQKCDFL
jgi:hypothetical protein